MAKSNLVDMCLLFMHVQSKFRLLGLAMPMCDLQLESLELIIQPLFELGWYVLL